MMEKCVGSVKTMLVAANVLTLIGGLTIFFISWSVRSDYLDHEQLMTDNFFFLPMFCIVTSAIILVACIVGFAGVWTEHYFLNIGFVVALIGVFVLHVTACVTGYMLRGNAMESVHSQLTSTLAKYEAPDNPVTIQWDDLQAEFKCCGVNNSTDWTKGLPVSCCKHQYGTLNQLVCDHTKAYNKGCAAEFGEWARSRATTLAIAETILLILQGVAMAVGIMMAKILRDDRGFI